MVKIVITSILCYSRGLGFKKFCMKNARLNVDEIDTWVKFFREYVGLKWDMDSRESVFWNLIYVLKMNFYF